MTPTARSMNRLRRLGFTVDVVERWIARPGIRKDPVRLHSPRCLIAQREKTCTPSEI
jgi:hypothetical protein